MEKRPEHDDIHIALHSPSKPRTVSVDGIHRFIKVNKNGKRYMTYLDKDGDEWLLTAIAPHITLINKLFMGKYLTQPTIRIRKFVN